MSPLRETSGLPRLEKYEIIEELGHGGMATVYLAKDPRLGREVAVKIIHKHLRENAEISARFDAEARAVAKLKHPNIVEVYDVSGADEADKYIVVELSRGVTLRRALTDEPDMPPEVAAALGVELASALAHAHAAGVIHRDLKPENVLIELGDDILVKLTDFGIAKILDAQGVTSTGQVLGSPAHMAPEQIEGGDVDARADVFGLGVLLYECMVGHLPFEGKNPAQVLRRVLEGAYERADREKPTVGARWAKILALALAKEASDRYPDMTSLMNALLAELANLGITEPRAELRRYFSDRAGYLDEHVARLLPVLTQRGEQSRKARDVPGAAADFNRALAYAPQDATLLKLVSRLQRGRATRRLIRSALVLGSGALLIGLSALAISRARGNLQKPGLPDPPPSAVSTPAPMVSVVTPPSTAVAVVTSPRVAIAERPVRRPVEAPPHLQRNVSFVVNPKGAQVRIDDSAPEELFAKIKPLSVGSHTFVAQVPPPHSKCCEVLRLEEEIKPDDGSGSPQQISLSLKFRPAMLSVPDAPPGAVLRCPMLNISGPAQQVVQVPMSNLEQDVSCAVEHAGVSQPRTSVTLRAGELTPVPWTVP